VDGDRFGMEFGEIQLGHIPGLTRARQNRKAKLEGNVPSSPLSRREKSRSHNAR